MTSLIWTTKITCCQSKDLENSNVMFMPIKNKMWTLFLLSTLLFISACQKEASTPIEPVKPAQVPAAAIWVGGVDGGVFVLVEKSEKLGKNVYLGEIHHASGDLAYKGPMQLFPDDAASLDSEMKNSFEGWDGDTLYLSNNRRLKALN